MPAVVDDFVEPAIGWAQSRLGSRDYGLRCLAFVEDAFERANGIEMFGGSSAAESAELYGVTPLAEVAPRGAMVFYECRGPINGEVGEWGHVGLSLGDGRLIHAWDEVRVDSIAGIEGLVRNNVWSAPRLLGWVAPNRFLRGWRPRTWNDA